MKDDLEQEIYKWVLKKLPSAKEHIKTMKIEKDALYVSYNLNYFDYKGLWIELLYDTKLCRFTKIEYGKSIDDLDTFSFDFPKSV